MCFGLDRHQCQVLHTLPVLQRVVQIRVIFLSLFLKSSVANYALIASLRLDLHPYMRGLVGSPLNAAFTKTSVANHRPFPLGVKLHFLGKDG